jgi:hypothetical protein
MGSCIRNTFIAVEKIGYLVLQLNPIAQAVVDVEKGSLKFTFFRTAEVRGGDVDFPVLLPGVPGSSVRTGGPP